MEIGKGSKSRKAKTIKNITKQRQKYPLLVQEIVDKSDIILEVLDARFISDTRNFELEEMIRKRKKRIIYVINKLDLVKDKFTKADLKGVDPSVQVSCKLRKGVKKLRDLIKMTSKKVEISAESKFDKVIVGVIGYPNTGKSSLINSLIGKSSAKTGAEAGFTKGIQKLRLTSDIILLDSPGVIPREEYSSIDQQAIMRHTKVGGRSYSQIKEPEIVVAGLMKEFPDVFEKHYKIESKGNSEILLEKLGRKKGFLKKGDKVNEDKTAREILKDWQEGKIVVK